MERVLSPEEKIKKAEEIYYRRKMQDYNKNYSRINVSNNKKDLKLFKKLFIQIFFCLTIYIAIYAIQNGDYFFSEEMLIKTKETLSYDLDIKSELERIKEYTNFILNNNIIKENDALKEQDNQENEETGKVEEKDETSNTDMINEMDNNNEQNEQLNDITQNNESVIDSKKMIIPLQGTITSRFGQRESNNPIVSKNHTGIDIAVEEGTVFKASMEGIVELVSSEGELGNHLKITNGNISTVYAHCKTIYVKEGEKIFIGQELGEVGQTRECYRTTFAF